MTQQRQEELELASQLLKALLLGPVHRHNLPRCMCMTDMRIAVQCLTQMGIKVERTDAGGNPTWQLV